MPSPPDSPRASPRLVGRAVARVEDAALLTGRGRFADDVGERPGTAHAAVLRSPHPHAEIVSLDAAAALSMPEVVTVLTGAEVAAWSRPFIAGVKQPMRHYALAMEIGAIGRGAGMPVNVNGSLEGGVGNAANLHLSAALEGEVLPGVITVNTLQGREQTRVGGVFYTDDVITEPFKYEDGCLEVPDRPGLGVVLNEDKIEKYRIN